MNLKNLNVLPVLFFVTLFGSSVFAADEATSASAVDGSASAPTEAVAGATTETTSAGREILNRTNLLFYTALEGPSVTAPSSSLQGSSLGDDDKTPTGERAKINFYNILSLRYNNSPVAHFQGDFRVNASPIGGKEFTTLNPRLSFGLKNVANWGGVKLSALKLRFEIPVTDAAIAKTQLVDPNLMSAWEYDFNGSRYNVGLSTETRLYTYSEKKAGNMNYYNILAPNAGIQINPKLSASLAFVHILGKQIGDPTIASTKEAYINPSIAYNFAESWTIAPYVYFYTNNKISLDASLYGFELSGTLF